MGASDGDDRRGDRRGDGRVAARLTLGPVTVSGVVVDAGAGGLFFETEVIVPDGAAGELVVHGHERGRDVRVTWSRPQAPGETPGLGLRLAAGTPAPELMSPRLAPAGTPPDGENVFIDKNPWLEQGPDAPPFEEKRSAQRQRVTLAAHLALDSLRIPGTIRDVTNDGLFFETTARVAPGQHVLLLHPHLRPAESYVVVREGTSGGRRGLGLRAGF
jgi:hypothetical protein